MRASSTWPPCWTSASRRLPGFALGEHHDSALAKAALCMAAAVRGGDVDRRDLPHRQGRRVRRRPLRPGLRRARGDPVDGPGRLGAGQRRRGELQLDPRARAPLPPALRHQGPGPPRGRPVHRRLQPPAPAQQLRDARHRSPTSSSSPSEPPERGPTGPGRVKPASQIAADALGATRWHQGAGECEAPSAISNPPRFRGKPRSWKSAAIRSRSASMSRLSIARPWIAATARRYRSHQPDHLADRCRAGLGRLGA